MPPTTPYSALLGTTDPLVAIRRSGDNIRAVVNGWSAADFERSYAVGKWSARLILTHLAQTEVALGYRARMALSATNYAAQPFDQDRWIARESSVSGSDALAAFLALSRLNLVLFESLTPEDRNIPLSHPEYGALTIDWIIHQMAGHQIHHLRQLGRIGESSRDR